jgi:rhodanese-related sulfurtransferase
MKAHMRLSIGTLVALALLIAACAAPKTAMPSTETRKNADGYYDISVEQLAEMMDGSEFTLINVHIPYEGNIPQTHLSIPYNTITDHLDELPAKDAPIVLYCATGPMSTRAAKDLAAQGYSNVMEVDGGMRAWTAAGYEIE